MEKWKVIDWIEGIRPIYAVSDRGNVKTLEYSRAYKSTDKMAVYKERTKAQQIDKDGYMRVMLYGKKPLKKFVPVHRLVAIAFIDNPGGYNQINHKDENKKNNDASNLEWCDCLYNNNYGSRNKRISKAKTGVKRPYLLRNKKGKYIEKEG